MIYLILALILSAFDATVFILALIFADAPLVFATWTLATCLALLIFALFLDYYTEQAKKKKTKSTKIKCIECLHCNTITKGNFVTCKYYTQRHPKYCKNFKNKNQQE